MTPHRETLSVAIVQLIIGSRLDFLPELARERIAEQIRLNQVSSGDIERNTSAALNVSNPSHGENPQQRRAPWASNRPGGWFRRQW